MKQSSVSSRIGQPTSIPSRSVIDLPNDSKETVNALKDGDHHLVLVLGGGLVLRMRARVDDPVHVEVQVVELDLVRVRPCRIHLGPDAVYHRVLHRGGRR